MLEQEYEITKTDWEVIFKDCLTNLTKKFSIDDRNNFTGTITDEYGIETNIEDGVVTPYYNKITDEVEREKIRVKYHFDSNNRVCDIEGYNKIHSIRKYQDNKLLLSCDGCFKDVRYLGNLVTYNNYLLTGTIDKIAGNGSLNLINGLDNNSLFKMNLNNICELTLKYENLNKKIYTGILIIDDLSNEKLKIQVDYYKDNQVIKSETYFVENEYFAFPICILEGVTDFTFKIIDEQIKNK